MARPFPTTFEKESSPMSPASAASGSNTPISYRANVNRQKTKKWADAKPADYGGADYGGDEWGDDDEYDVPSPPPISKPTGRRQPGQAAPSGPNSETPIYETKKSLGQLPPLPATSDGRPSRPRANSFDHDDEKRNFSSGILRQPSPIATSGSDTATPFAQTTGVTNTRHPNGPPALSISTQQLPQVKGLRKASQVAASPTSGSPHPDVLVPGPPGGTNSADSGPLYSAPSRVNTGESGSVYSQPPDIRTSTPSSDYQARRDYSPSAVPPPLATRVSRTPQSATDSPSARFPARKSSLSQSTGPELSEITGVAQEPTTSKPWVAGRSASPGASSRSSSAPQGKALPFIRPADIYRRAEEERERERQSIDSSRPSMDSIVGAHSSDRSDSPAKPVLRDKSSSDSLGGGRQRTTYEREDTADSSRRLLPMLEPVKERKSEYGFEGLNLNDQDVASTQVTTTESQSLNSSALDPEKGGRQSFSPKLPDLNRISTFGIDLFSPRMMEDVKSSLPRVSDPAPRTSTVDSPQADESGAPRQASLGFNSVVNQAFDTKDDSSLPPTPASQTGSGLRRIDSEGTDTTGISPIMNRFPSATVSDFRKRDAPALPIIEAAHEPSSPADAIDELEANLPKHPDASVPPGIKPGYRRKMRTPSPGNSPARTPDVAKTEFLAHSQEAAIADYSFPDSTKQTNEEESSEPSQPIASRDQSFRPTLPGSWSSYATTTTSDASQQEAGQAPVAVEHTRTQANQISSTLARHDADNLDITLTAGKHSLPPSVFGAAAEETFRSGIGEDLERHDKDSPNPSPISENAKPTLDIIGPTTPNPAVTPIGTLDSTTLTGRRRISPEPHLQSDLVKKEASSESSATPTLPAKHIPVLETADDSVAYLPNLPLPFKEKSPDGDEAVENLNRTTSQIVPMVSRETKSQDHEGDKLREEIVKSLSHEPSTGAAHNKPFLPDKMDEETSSNPTRISSYLPSEYDNYWAATSEDPEPAPLVTIDGHKFLEGPAQTQLQPPVVEEPPTHNEVEGLSISALGTRRADNNLGAPRPPLQNRFSWEISNEDVSFGQSQDEEQDVLPSIPRSANDAVEVTTPQSLMSAKSDDGDAGRNGALLAGGAVLGGATAAAVINSRPTQPKLQSERQISLTREKDAQFSSYAVSPSPPEDEHPSRSPQAHFPPPTEHLAHPAETTPISPLNSSVKTQFLPTTRILAFKEIVAIKSPYERIQTFDETRHRFAGMETGLTDWMLTLRAQHPEHANANGSWGGSATFKSTVAAASPLQQSNYQQHLNTSPAAPGTPTSRPILSMPTGSQQSFSPAGGKLSSQQVQAKGKELLHTAGIFGGKAGKAGKGLLAKGKNKLRGSGAGDKIPASPQSKPKTERRASWGIPLTMSRSSGQPDASTSQSKDSNTLHMAERLRESSMTSDRGPPVFNTYMSVKDDSHGMVSNRLPTTESRGVQYDEPIPQRGLPSSTESEIRGTLGVPAPIGKTQPSWDPNSVPLIAEEEAAFKYNRSLKQQQPMGLHPETQQETAPIPRDAASREEISSHVDPQPYDLPEEQLNDWVVVSPGAQFKGVPSTAEPAGVQVGEDPSTSDLNQPGSSHAVPLQIKAHTSTIQAQNIGVQQIAQVQHQHADLEEPSRNASFKGLPPIRRISTFGVGFGPHQSKPRFRVQDEGEGASAKINESESSRYDAEGDEAAGAETAVAFTHGQVHQDAPQHISEKVASDFSQQPQHLINHPSTTRPELIQANSSEYRQQTIVPQTEPQSEFRVPRASDTPTAAEGFRRSQDAWRPNAVAPPSQQSPTKWMGTAVSPQRSLLEQQRSRGLSGSGQGFAQRSDGQYNDRMSRSLSNQTPMLSDQPPSSAQRYPDLFRPEQHPSSVPRDGELPAHYYQAPLPRDAAFLPRHQTNEYQLQGVGPPDEPRSDGQRRNSALLRDLGGRISRGTSRERGTSFSRDGMISPGRTVDSRGGYEYAESSIASEEVQEQQKRRSNFFRHMNRASTTGLGPPQSQESVVAHFPASRTDLTADPQPSPVRSHERKRSFFGASSSEPKSKPNKLTRSSTSALVDEPGKKKRFSGLSGIFSRPANAISKGSMQDRPQATRERSYDERQPIESAPFDPRQTGKQPPQPQNARRPSLQPNLLTKHSAGSGNSKPRQESKTHRSSTSGLLSVITGRRSQQQDNGTDDSSSQGTRSHASQGRHHPQQLPPSQTYTDLQQVQTQNAALPSAQSVPFPGQPNKPAVRGRPLNRDPREPQYDRVPIPGGYSLVRAEGGIPVPTEYHLQQQIDPRYDQKQTRGQYTQSLPTLQGGPQGLSYEQQAPRPQPENRHSSQTKPPTLSSLETYENYTSLSQRPLSREDILARSPAIQQDDQQRPYQLSLPEDTEDREDHPSALGNGIAVLPPSNSTGFPLLLDRPQVRTRDPIQRLTQPVLRHPDSPAGYPLPDDVVFSPINEAARDLPPPPPPKWPSHLYNQPQNLESALDRSNTRGTALSGVSQVSAVSRPHGVGLNVPSREDGSGRERITPSPTPPSPADTPDREVSPHTESEKGQDSNTNLVTTDLSIRHSPDLYDASPKLAAHSSWRAGNGNADKSDGKAARGKENNKKVAELANTESDTHRARRAANAQEEKIFYNAGDSHRFGVGGEEEPDDDDGVVAMTATSYPGQEWNPYAGANWEEGYD